MIARLTLFAFEWGAIACAVLLATAASTWLHVVIVGVTVICAALLRSLAEHRAARIRLDRLLAFLRAGSRPQGANDDRGAAS